MTVIDVTAAVTAIGGRAAVQDGSVLIEYLYGEDGIPSTRTDGSTALLPNAIRVPIVDGVPTIPVDVPPTDGECYARVTVAAVKPYAPTPLVLSAVAIPPAGPVAISALVPVDPATYEPATDVVTAWHVAIAQVTAIQTDVTQKAAQAASSAADAGTFAGAADFDADRAGQSAFQAGQSAASALGHKNDAKGSADAAAGSATSAAGAVVAANLERQGAADERLGARQERQDAQTARTGAETAQSGAVTARTGAETARTGAETAKTGAETARTGAEQARDLALTGQFLGSGLTSANDLNAITTPGVYRCPSGAFATSANNYPAVGVAGVLMVTQWGGAGQVIQRYTPYPSTGSPNIVIGEWIRSYRGSAFSAWRFMASQRINNPAGQPGMEVFTFDDANVREQSLLPVGIALGTVDLNAVTVPGIYSQPSVVSASNYPMSDTRGVLEVSRTGTETMQRFTRSSSSGPRSVYVRNTWGGVFSAWQHMATQRVDQTAGRAIYTWDDVNLREQLVYGDTGWRDVTSLLINGATATLATVRRYGSTVYIRFVSLQLPSTQINDPVYSFPSGFLGIETYGLLRENVNTGNALGFVMGSTARLWGNVGSAAANNTTNRFTGVLTAVTDQAWPTALPGVAYGGIQT